MGAACAFRPLCSRFAVRARANRIMPIYGHPCVPCARAIYKETPLFTETSYTRFRLRHVEHACIPMQMKVYFSCYGKCSGN